VARQQILAGLRDTRPLRDPVAQALAALPGPVVDALFPSPPIPAAVLVPICGDGRGLSVLLTRRTADLRDHPGQISFPGGRLEGHDDGPTAAALREAFEEIGLSPGDVELAGYLPPHAVVTGFVVTPVVGFVQPGFVARPDPREVAEVFSVPLDFLLEPRNLHTGPRDIGTVRLTTYFWQYGHHRIWGATAHMLKTLCDLINAAS
jgi:8-oxo-dGTP pyrophosphatase MutT (NUDIX family)